MANKGPLEKKSGGVLGAIERIGNALPSPFILFLWLVVILVALTTVLAALGVSAGNPTTQEVVTVQSLLTRDGLVWILGSLVSNFSGFAALGIVLVMQMAIGVTEEAAQMIDPSYTTTPANNWYFMIASCFVLTIVGTLVNDHIIEPRLGKYTGARVEAERDVTPLEKKGLRNAGIFTVIFIAIILIGLIPANGILRGDDGSIINGPFVTGLVPFLLAFFVLVGVVYGFTVGSFKKVDDIPRVMADSLTSLTGYIVLVFVIAQFIAIFNYTNLAMVIAVNAATFLDNVGLTGVPLILAILIVTTFVNFFMTSGSAKWYIFAPIFVPMFMMLGFAPEFAQAVYRIAGSCTNPITPIYPYLPMVIGMAAKYDKKFGMGNVISLMIPYSFGFLIVWTVFIILWMFLNLPLGPGAGVFL